jgi:hypothetical protein
LRCGGYNVGRLARDERTKCFCREANVHKVIRRTDDLTEAELAEFPVWEYLNYEDTQVTPVCDLPVNSFNKRIVGTKLRLHNGTEVWGVLSNVHLRNAKQHEHFLCVWVEKEGKWSDLARYHDVDREERSPERLAAFLGLSVDEVFPITYDISAVASGLPDSVRGVISAEPKERLNRDQLINLALEPRGEEE